MLLLADSGSTKTDWALIVKGGEEVIRFSSPGLNPVTMSAEHITAQLAEIETLRLYKHAITVVHFFGAGCAGIEPVEHMRTLLNAVLPNATIHADSDMAGAVHACSDHKPCIVGILGTGANSCYFDGKNILGTPFSIGYILGDEGSGAWFGKKLINAIHYQLLPTHLAMACNKQFDLDREKIVQGVYRSSAPAAFLATFFPFILAHKEEPLIAAWIQEGLQTYIRHFILRFEQAKHMPVHFIGSVSVLLEQELKQACTQHGLQLASAIANPMEGLIQKYRFEESNNYGNI